MDHSKQNYYESQENSDGLFRFKIYHYDESGNKEIIIYTSPFEFYDEAESDDSAIEWLEENGIEAELA